MEDRNLDKLPTPLPLTTASPAGWLQEVLNNFDGFLLDHAACERKASALAMSYVVKFPDKPALVEPMICLAKEELAHFHEVYREIHRRGLQLGPDEKDPYVKGLLAQVRHGRSEHFLDRLLISGIIEARGCERFQMIGANLSDQRLGEWYRRLGREEAGHYKIFINSAKHYFPRSVVEQRLQQLLEFEGQFMLTIPYRACVH